MFSIDSYLTIEESSIEKHNQRQFPKICAWCKDVYGTNVIDNSAGICNGCLKTLVSSYVEMLDIEEAKTFQQMLNSVNTIIKR